jgi:hypothetical protein
LTLLNINAVHTFLQIVQNSRKPLEIIREAIANAYDNGAGKLDITIDYDKSDETVNITFKDNGTGLLKEDIEFYIFGLGNSTKLNAEGYIGNKGVGTLLYLKSKLITVTSFIDGKGARQEWLEPYKSLVRFRDSIDNAQLTREDLGIKNAEDIEYQGEPNGTTIQIKGFLHRNPLEYHHENVTDFILWFTKMGSFGQELASVSQRTFTVRLKGLEFKEVKNQSVLDTDDIIETGFDSYIDKNKIKTRKRFETLKYGFPFPSVSNNESLVLNEKLLTFSKQKKVIKELKKDLVMRFTSEDSDFSDFELEFPYRDSLDITQNAKIEFVVYRIGENARTTQNKMLKRLTNQLPSYKYIVSERYGIYLAKDYTPVQMINTELQSIGGGGHGKTQYLGFFNCQKIDLTIDRTGAATIDEELQIKLNNKINKLMVKIDGLVDNKVNELFSKVEERKPKDNDDTTEEPEGTGIGPEGTGIGPEGTGIGPEGTGIGPEGTGIGPEGTGIGPEGTGTGSNFSAEVQRFEIQDKITRKAKRIHRISLKKSLSTVTLENKELILREPNNESELYGTLMQVISLKPDILGFNILDYNTTKGIDFLATDRQEVENNFNNVFHVELKTKLTGSMNHLLEDAKYVVCWSIDESLRRSLLLRDKFQNIYRLDRDGAGYILIRENPSHRVRVIELKDLIESQFGQFLVRT